MSLTVASNSEVEQNLDLQKPDSAMDSAVVGKPLETSPRKEESGRSGDEAEKAPTNGAARRRQSGRRLNNRDRYQPQRRRQRNQSRNWEKNSVEGMVVTHVETATCIYMQTPQQQKDYQKLKDCMTQQYAGSSYTPSLVAAKMLLAVKIGESFERVRTEETRTCSDASSNSDSEQKTGLSSTTEWKVNLIDRGSWTYVKEDSLNFLIGGMSDVAPLAAKYNMNELRFKKDSTEAEMEECRLWLQEKTADTKVTAEIYKPNRDLSGTLFVDLYIGDSYLNKDLLSVGAIEPKLNPRWLRDRDQASSHDESASPSKDRKDLTDGDTISSSDELNRSPRDGGEKRERRVRHEKGDLEDGQKRDNGDAHEGNEDGNERRRGRNFYNKRRASSRLPPLRDWAVICFDPRTCRQDLSALCDMVVTIGKENKASVTPVDNVQHDSSSDEKAMVNVITEMISTHPRLLLLLCVLPNHVEDYGALERAGRSLGVCVVCMRGDKLAVPNSATSTKLLHEMQTSMQNSPAILPPQKSGNAQRRMRRKRNQQQNGRRTPSNRDSNVNDPRLQAVTSAANQGLSLIQKLLTEDPKVQQNSTELTKALGSLEELQTTFKAKSCTAEVYQAASNFFSYLSSVAALDVPAPTPVQ